MYEVYDPLLWLLNATMLRPSENAVFVAKNEAYCRLVKINVRWLRE